MDYEKVKSFMPANRRRWCKWSNCTYLQKFRGTIRVRYGYRYRHSQVIAIWYPDGRCKFSAHCYYPSQRVLINCFLPDGYKVYGHRYYSFLGVPGGKEEPRAFYIRSGDRLQNSPVGGKWIMITKRGVLYELGETLETVRLRLLGEDYQRDKPRRRGRYWLRKARGVYRKPCGKDYNNGCTFRRIWPRPTTEWTGECGCHVYTKKARSRDTVSTIMAEENATVRTAKIQIYGIERFFTDAGAKTINKEAGYELVTLDTGRAHHEPDRWRGREQTANVVLTALRMECSTTGKVYVNTVPPQINTVRAALDWMYDIPNYLMRVSQQT